MSVARAANASEAVAAFRDFRQPPLMDLDLDSQESRTAFVPDDRPGP